MKKIIICVTLIIACLSSICIFTKIIKLKQEKILIEKVNTLKSSINESRAIIEKEFDLFAFPKNMDTLTNMYKFYNFQKNVIEYSANWNEFETFIPEKLPKKMADRTLLSLTTDGALELTNNQIFVFLRIGVNTATLLKNPTKMTYLIENYSRNLGNRIRILKEARNNFVNHNYEKGWSYLSELKKDTASYAWDDRFFHLCIEYNKIIRDSLNKVNEDISLKDSK